MEGLRIEVGSQWSANWCAWGWPWSSADVVASISRSWWAAIGWGRQRSVCIVVERKREVLTVRNEDKVGGRRGARVSERKRKEGRRQQQVTGQRKRISGLTHSQSLYRIESSRTGGAGRGRGTRDGCEY